MGTTVADLSDRLSYEEYTEWVAFYHLEPWGAERDDLRSGWATAGLARMWADPKKAKNITPSLFMPFYEPPEPKRKTPQELMAAFDAMTGG